MERKKIMLVDDSVTNLAIGKNALINDYDVFTIPSGEKLLAILDRITPDLILLDVHMPDMDGYEVIRRLKKEPRTANIPVIFLTGSADAGSELEGLSLGAVDYITKPFSPPLLLKRLELHLLIESQKTELTKYNDNLQKMVEAKTKTVLELQNAVFELLAEVVEYRDDETGGHIFRTQSFYQTLMEGMKTMDVYTEEISKWDEHLVVMSSQLHDLGKVAIRDNLLLKPGKLTAEEFEEMKKHTLYGAKIIERIEKNTAERTFISHATIMTLTHHEKWDGSGYPAGLSGTDIPLEGRIMAIVDVYDALVSRRPYKEPMTHEQAVQIIKDSAGKHFDPVLVNVFLSVHDKFKHIDNGKIS